MGPHKGDSAFRRMLSTPAPRLCPENVYWHEGLNNLNADLTRRFQVWSAFATDLGTMAGLCVPTVDNILASTVQLVPV